MALSSNTGLIESVRKPIEKKIMNPIELSCLSGPAPFVLRPFAGLYNPFSPGCSILCNHPADAEIKDVVKKAKDAIVSDNKLNFLVEEMAALRASLQQAENQAINDSTVDFVPEELFRRYTQTDSRPLTPAPTLASAVSRGSLRRRCLTPDQPPQQRKKLVLDLRRSHSQETLYWHGFQTSDVSSGLGFSSLGASGATPATSSPAKLTVGVADGQIPPMVSPATLSRRSPHLRGNVSDRTPRLQKNQLRVLQAKHLTQNKAKTAPSPEVSEDPEEIFVEQVEVAQENTELVEAASSDLRRRGRRKKGKHRVLSAVLVSNTENDPETQIAGIGSESHNASSRASVAANDEADLNIASATTGRHTRTAAMESFLEPEVLKHLQREVDNLAIESEFDPKRRYIFEEAMRTRTEKSFGKEMSLLLKEMKLPPNSINKWLHVPRVFSRKNAMFSLPIDRRDLVGLSPVRYVAEYATVTQSKQLLYQTVLQKFNPDSYMMPLEFINEALCVMMGETLNEETVESFKSLLKWDMLTTEDIKKMSSKGIFEESFTDTHDSKIDNSDCGSVNLFAEFDAVPEKNEENNGDGVEIHFRLWCGICALCERLYGPMPSINKDRPHEVEVADFDTLQGKLSSEVDENLIFILVAIQKTHSNNECISRTVSINQDTPES